MASKKRKAAVQVDIDDFLLERKRKKQISSIMNEYCDKLKDIKAEEVSGKEENVATWLVSKYGFHSVAKAIECYHRLPVILNETERQRLINEEVSVVAEIIQLVERVCPSLLVVQQPTSDDEKIILTPPVNECIECGHVLTLNHICSVKVYSLEKSSKAQKITLLSKIYLPAGTGGYGICHYCNN